MLLARRGQPGTGQLLRHRLTFLCVFCKSLNPIAPFVALRVSNVQVELEHRDHQLTVSLSLLSQTYLRVLPMVLLIRTLCLRRCLVNTSRQRVIPICEFYYFRPAATMFSSSFRARQLAITVYARR